MKKLISIDLDGVLNNYNGEYDKDCISSMKDGAFEFLKKLYLNFDIEIFTVRNNNLTKQWLKKNDLYQFITSVTREKNPNTSIFLDDRAINFDGSFERTMEEIKRFKPYWKN